jgi:Zn finger protein HypA/HybF involved in hydrogenase expression
MHELGITEGIIGRAREAAQAAGGVRVTDVYLRITPAADFTIDSIEMYFEMLTADDDYFRGVKLHWEQQTAAASCLECGAAFQAAETRPVCPHCGGRQVRFDLRAPMLQLVGVDVAEEGDRGPAGPPGPP